jgi:membrane protease YdiL (CAAX protease family)
MKHTATTTSVWTFFLLVFLLSLPVYVLGLVPPYSLLMVFNPFIAASLLTSRKTGWDGVRRLWGRSFDYTRIRRNIWYLPLILLIPATTILQYGLTRLMGVSISGLQFPLLMMLVYLLVFFLLAIGEEVGWSGYALDPLQDWWEPCRRALSWGRSGPCGTSCPMPSRTRRYGWRANASRRC